MVRRCGLLFLLFLSIVACSDKREKAPHTGCKDDEACDGGRCDPRHGCVECLFDSDCSKEERCLDRSCRQAVACTKDDDCTKEAESRCSPQSSYCVECVSERDCPGLTPCRAGVCETHEVCRSDSDCSNGWHCAPTSRKCVECVSDNECSGSERCADQHCVIPCNGDAECSSTAPHCGRAGHCVECTTEAHCPEVYHCTGGVCELDVCDAGAKRCQTDGMAVLSCSETGDAFLPSPCTEASRCAPSDSDPRCETRECSPDTWECESERVLTHCGQNGEIDKRIDCSERDQVCKDGECQEPLVCTAGKLRCIDGDLYRCDANGSAENIVQACEAGTTCDAERGTCVPTECVPGSTSCDGDVIEICREDGTAYEPEGTDCSKTDEVCWKGACKTRECVGDQCQGNDSYHCVDKGTRLEHFRTCNPLGSPAQYCNPVSGNCEAVLCEPLTPICNGELATTCLPDGTGPGIDGVDCAARGEACWNGSCLSIICSETYVCDGADLLRCEDNGTALVLERTCDAPELCDATRGHCGLGACNPSAPVCSGSIAGTCAESGQGFGPEETTDCAESGQGCLAGECRPRLCTAGEYLCIDGNVHRCDPSEVATTLVHTCLDTEHCQPGRQTCAIDRCTPDAPVCDGDRATKCNTSGSGPEPTGGVDCKATDRLCHLGNCAELLCVPGAHFCQNGHVRLCSTNGLASGPYQNCLFDEHCMPKGEDNAECVLDVCNQGDACDGEVLASCNADGSGYYARFTDCGASNAVCDLSSQCLSLATDTLGGTDFPFEIALPTAYINVLQVFSPRRLDSVGHYLGVEPATTLTFAVYEADALDGPYKRVFMTDAAAEGEASGALHRVEGLDVELRALHYYALAVSVSAPHIIAFNSDPDRTVLSFARARGEYAITHDQEQTLILPDTLTVGSLTSPVSRWVVETRSAGPDLDE